MRELFDRMPAAVETVCSRYLAEDGSALWPHPSKIGKGLVDGLDDVYEGFHSWPLAYLLGADESLQNKAEEGFEAVTRQFSSIPTGSGHPMVVNEYEQGYDWFHQGEGYLFFYYLCAARPELSIHQERAVRFSGFLRNEGVPEPMFNFETFHFLSPHIGSMGPAPRNFEERSGLYPALLKYYGLPFQTDRTSRDPMSCFSNPACSEAYAHEAAARLAHGDSVINLASTSLAINAYLVSGDKKHRDWALKYIDGWMLRADENGGIIPDNVGLTGKVGEHTGGDWFGGNYGWVWPHGWHSLGQTVTMAMQNALMLTGDPKYPAFLRRHLEHLASLGIEHENTLHVPYKHGNPGWYNYDTSIPMLAQVLREPSGPVVWRDGWFEFTPIESEFPVWLWEMTQEPEDARLLERLRNHRSEDWKCVQDVHAKDLGGHYAPWAAYLRGEFPDYPERILEHNLAQMNERLEFIAQDKQDPITYGDAYLQHRNPISNEGILQLTLGASMPVYNGGLLHTRLRYYDADRRRCGLPMDVSALVERLDAQSVDLCLVNLHPHQPRCIILRAGFFAEHRFTGAIDLESGLRTLLQHDQGSSSSDLYMSLTPRSSLRVRLEMQRFVNPPTACLPDWDGKSYSDTSG